MRADAKTIPLADESVQCVVTSPPYWGLRDYGVTGQLGLEKTPEEYVANMVAVFREVRRCLRPDGTLWLNLGDSYHGSWGNSGQRPELDGKSDAQRPKETSYLPRGGWDERRERPASSYRLAGLKPKDLVGIPWRVAFALQADGWWLRQDIIWAKPNPMPESVTDRCTKSHEYVFLLTKNARYFYDAEAVKEPGGDGSTRWGGAKMDLATPKAFGGDSVTTQAANRPGREFIYNGSRNLRSVWNIATQPYKFAHFATFPEKLVEPCILAGTSEKGCCARCGAPWERITESTRTFESGSGRAGNLPAGKNGPGLQGGGETLDIRRGPVVHSTTVGWKPACSCGADTRPCIVLDPFCGSGTVGVVCARTGRDFIGLDISEQYLALARQRIGEVPFALPFHAEATA